jgi:F-type H+-transporting ATPase subunit b
MEMLNTLGIDWGMLIAQMINFGILLAALTYFLYKPVLRVIDERATRVRQSMDHAAKLEHEVAEMEKERKKRLKEMDEQARSFLEQSRKQAEGAKKEIVDSAQAEVNQMLEKGRKQLEDERRKLLADLQKTVTSVSVQLAEKVLEREFSDSDQKRLMQALEKDVPSLIK